MSDIQVVTQTQRIEVESDSSISVINAGPPGPPGANGGVSLEEVDSRVALHNQAEVVHTNATSGRDFVALFQNGLV